MVLAIEVGAFHESTTYVGEMPEELVLVTPTLKSTSHVVGSDTGVQGGGHLPWCAKVKAFELRIAVAAGLARVRRELLRAMAARYQRWLASPSQDFSTIGHAADNGGPPRG
jgi:hypothetical protein